MSITPTSCPSPLCGSAGGFTYISIVKRLGAIMDKTIQNNPQFSEQEKHNLLALRDEISDEKGLVPKRNIQFESDDEEYKEWKSYEDSFNVKKKTWLTLPWFFVENYFYRIILDITGYFNPQSPGYHVDPFEKQKKESLTGPLEAGSVKATSESVLKFYEQYEKGPNDAHLRDFISLMLVSDLWGNQADLSFSGGASVDKIHKEHDELREHVIINNEDKIMDTIIKSINKKGRYAMIVDNCGQEFISDLFFAEVLTHFGVAETVTFFVKAQPVFVSDVMQKDVDYTIHELTKHEGVTSHFGKRFQNYFSSGQWNVQPDRYFTSPLPFWELPARLRDQFATYDMIIIKGDANYRRLINDALWPLTTSFSELLKYFPSNVVALRTLKSDSLVGMIDESEERHDVLRKLNKNDPEWRVNGKYGVIQYSCNKL
jgi:uncharacterized protein with ATP-grasp and redox domains